MTDKRVIGKTGFFSRLSVEVLLGKVEGIVVQQDLTGRMLDYGTVIVSGTGTTKTSFAGITALMACRRAIQDTIGSG